MCVEMNTLFVYIYIVYHLENCLRWTVIESDAKSLTLHVYNPDIVFELGVIQKLRGQDFGLF